MQSSVVFGEVDSIGQKNCGSHRIAREEQYLEGVYRVDTDPCSVVWREFRDIYNGNHSFYFREIDGNQQEKFELMKKGEFLHKLESVLAQA